MNHILKLSGILLFLCFLFINSFNWAFASDSNNEESYTLKFRQIINLPADIQKQPNFNEIKTIAQETGWTYNASKNCFERLVLYQSLDNLEIKVNGYEVKYKKGQIKMN